MPQHGGVNRCQGDNYEFQVCNTHECVDTHGRKTVDDFRDYQCQQLNNRALYQSQIVEWNAGYLDDHSACQLVCSTKIQCRGFGNSETGGRGAFRAGLKGRGVGGRDPERGERATYIFCSQISNLRLSHNPKNPCQCCHGPTSKRRNTVQLRRPTRNMRRRKVYPVWL